MRFLPKIHWDMQDRQDTRCYKSLQEHTRSYGKFLQVLAHVCVLAWHWARTQSGRWGSVHFDRELERESDWLNRSLNERSHLSSRMARLEGHLTRVEQDKEQVRGHTVMNKAALHFWYFRPCLIWKTQQENWTVVLPNRVTWENRHISYCNTQVIWCMSVLLCVTGCWSETAAETKWISASKRSYWIETSVWRKSEIQATTHQTIRTNSELPGQGRKWKTDVWRRVTDEWEWL